MFRTRVKPAAGVALLAWAVVLVAPARASAQSDRPPGLKGYALVQWMDAHRTRPTPTAYAQPFGPSVYIRPSVVYPQHLASVQPRYWYAPSRTFTLPAAPAWVTPGRMSPCGGR